MEAATYAHGSNEMPPRVVEDLSAVEEMMKRNITGLDIVGALSRSGFEDIASNILNMLRQRVTGDYLQASAILDRQFRGGGTVSDINDYQGPGTGYPLCRRWAEIKIFRAWFSPTHVNRRYSCAADNPNSALFCTLKTREGGVASADERADEVVIGVGLPSINTNITL